MTDFKNVAISEIRPDPNQPRRFYDELAMQELTQSVKEKGILQPILIRPNGKGFILVCGERRFRAASAAGLDEMPAVIRQLTDEEALELQIIENLQRKDVHPMEEAIAFKSLIEKRTMSYEEIAKRIGKTIFYVRQRIHLNNLSPKWQKVVYANVITLANAFKIAALPEKDQTSLYDDIVNEDNIKNGRNIDVNDWKLREYKGDLSNASFPLDDTTLDKKMGACTTCKFNSAVASLFPEDAKNPHCNNTSCFKHKSDIQFDRELKNALEDPAVVLISTEYNPTQAVFEKYKKQGHSVLRKYQDYDSNLSVSDKPSLEDFDLDDYDSETERQKDFEDSVKSYNKDLAEQDKKLASGKLHKAFIVDGNDRGHYICVELKKGKKNIKPTAGASTSDVEIIDIASEIKRIQDREKRNKELDSEKVYAKVKEALPLHKGYIDNLSQLSDHELEAAGVAIWHSCSPDARKLLNKFSVFPKDNYTSAAKVLTALKGITHLGLNQAIRILITDKLIDASTSAGGNTTAITQIATEYFPEQVAAFTKEQKEISERRADRVSKKITQLNAQKKEITAKKLPATKKK